MLDSELVGRIDVAQRTRLAGWAHCPNVVDTPVELILLAAATISAPARELGRCLANRYRPDRDVRGVRYEGRVGFDVDLRAFDLPPGTFLLDVRDASSGSRVPGAPCFLPAAHFAPPPVPYLAIARGSRPLWRVPSDIVCCVPAGDGWLRVEIPPGRSGVLLCPRARAGSAGDVRRLGACVTRLEWDGSSVDLGHDGLSFGFHEVEGSPGAQWRWTDDAAFIGVAARDNGSCLAFDLQGVTREGASEGFADPWRLSAAFSIVAPSSAALPYVGRRFLGLPVAPDPRVVKVRVPLP
jgi:hypothetical protein